MAAFGGMVGKEAWGRGNCPDKSCSVMMGDHGDTRPRESGVQCGYMDSPAIYNQLSEEVSVAAVL